MNSSRAKSNAALFRSEVILRFLERGDEFVQGKIQRRAEGLCDGTGHCGLRASGAKASSSMNSGKMLSSWSVTSTMRRATAFRESGSVGLKSLLICRLLFLFGLSSSKEPSNRGATRAPKILCRSARVRTAETGTQESLDC